MEPLTSAGPPGQATGATKSGSVSGCASFQVSRRALLAAGAAAPAAWLTSAAAALARQAEAKRGGPAKSLIWLWMQGGPSQLETFDPHPNSPTAFGSKAIRTSVPDVLVGDGLPRTAERLDRTVLLRSVVSKEGDHERGTYFLKSGYVPNPAVVHPSIGAVCCHASPDPAAEIPRHVTILPGEWPAWGGYFGPQFDAFKSYDPRDPVPDVNLRVETERYERRRRDLAVVSRQFTQGRRLPAAAAGHDHEIDRARRMMTSKQLRAFNVLEEPAAVRERYGDTPFGRGCLAALRLTQAGVRCVEVTLDGWDTHLDNHELQRGRCDVLDPALAALLDDLEARGEADSTLLVCCGEFGRTPKLNPLGGRDHWPNGFSVLLAGGGLRRGVVEGETDPSGAKGPARPVAVVDVHATILTALGIDPAVETTAPIGRPLKYSEGKVLGGLLERG